MTETKPTYEQWCEAREGREWASYAEYIADARAFGLEGQELARAYADYRPNWRAMIRGRSLDYDWRMRRKGVKGEGRSYMDASYATEDGAA